jgi:hypothetical protein
MKYNDDYHPASPIAQQALRRWLRKRQPARILEVGAGAGTLTRVILNEVPGSTLRFVEDAEVCLPLLYGALPVTEAQRVRDDDAATAGPYDLVVIDGGTRTATYYEALAARAVVLVEGGRRDQRAVLERVHRGRRAYSHRHVKPRDRSKGYHVYLFEPSPGERLVTGVVMATQHALDLLARALNRVGGSYAIGKRRRA